MTEEQFLQESLDKRIRDQAFRTLKLTQGLTDFCSNDYLGLARNPDFQERILNRIRAGGFSFGSTGSRLLSGNNPLAEETEQILADFHLGEAALLFNSGYDANLGLFSCLGEPEDTILYDQLIHASIRDGIRLSRAQSHSFRHNDPADLEARISECGGRIFVAVESIYSMDGDLAPLADLVRVCRQRKALLIVDEAHATGIIGDRGEGLTQQLGLQDGCFARVYTFGKALGVHGAAVVGSETLKNYLINFARSFIFTTALAPASLMAIALSYQVFPGMEVERRQLDQLVGYYRSCLPEDGFPVQPSAIQVLRVPGNEKARSLSEELRAGGLDVRAILHPSVPRGQERLRIVLHSFNTRAEVKKLAGFLAQPPPSGLSS